MPKNLNTNAVGDYATGYGRPPVHSRWKPGQSGNPKGRPALSGDPAENAHKLFNEQIVVPLNGVPTRMTFAQALVRQMMMAALGGNMPAVRELLRQYEKHLERTKSEIQMEYDIELILEDDPPSQHTRS